MSKNMSVSAIRGRNAFRRQIPKEGTRLRRLYDLLVSNRGKPIEVPMDSRRFAQSMITQLVDFYGLDIRWFARGQYILVGEWVGKVYIDYLSDGADAPQGLWALKDIHKTNLP